MTEPAVIQRDAYYAPDLIRRTLGLRINPVNEARKRGELRSIRRGGRVLIRGDWLEAWLIGAEQPEGELAVTS